MTCPISSSGLKVGSNTQEQAMKEYLFFIEGLNREVWQSGTTEKEAKNALWLSLSSGERDAVVIFDCIDERQKGAA